ncbi:hypothetical protein [Mesorhizobium sp. M0006]|uniref:hypothetical protein n=1 Tax=Mesorhizobium sp. M0006 TaxID=2956838 RepID=UPI00333A5B2C
MTDYRNQAREYLASAKAELASSDNRRLKYAALDLRFAVEALTFDRATAYKSEMPPAEFETWQPRKLMALLLEIDPSADKDSTIAVGIEETYGVLAPVMQSLGTESVFNLALLKKHYDALGNYLHVPTLRQMQNAPPSLDKLRERCLEIAGYVEKVLASPVLNATFGNFATIECQNCGATLRKRIPHGVHDVRAQCFVCPATYTITDAGDGQVAWQLDMVDVSCADKNCDQVIHILRSELKAGSAWECPGCQGRNTLMLAVSHEPKAKPSP